MHPGLLVFYGFFFNIGLDKRGYKWSDWPACITL